MKREMQTDELIECLKGPLGLTKNIEMRSVSGGVINRSYYLRDDINEFLVKQFKEEDFLCIDRQERFELQVTLSNCGIAPKPIYLSLLTGIYVEQWIPQQTSLESPSFNEHQINALASALTRVHTMKVKTTSVDLPAQWHRYLSVIPKPPSGLLDEVINETKRWAAVMQSTPNDQVFCHNDLLWAHLCDAAQIMFDWEYAGIGNRYFDILSCARVNDLNKQQHDRLLTAYAAQNNMLIHEVFEGCSQQANFVELSYQLWYQAIDLTPKI